MKCFLPIDAGQFFEGKNTLLNCAIIAKDK